MFFMFYKGGEKLLNRKKPIQNLYKQKRMFESLLPAFLFFKMKEM